jgi:hypothetical protein
MRDSVGSFSMSTRREGMSPSAMFLAGEGEIGHLACPGTADLLRFTTLRGARILNIVVPAKAGTQRLPSKGTVFPRS